MKFISIRKRLFISNLAMIVIPFALFLGIELIAAVFFIYGFEGKPDSDVLESFHAIRLAGLLVSIAIANGMITYIASKSILKHIQVLTQAAKEISKGELEFSIAVSSNDELGELVGVFEQMRGTLLESREQQRRYEENRKQLIASISHDLGTPLTSIKGYARGILDGIAGSPQKLEHYAQTIYLHTSAMEKMIEELFLYSKLDLRRVPMHMVEVDLRLYLADYLEELSYRLEPKGVSIHLEASPNETYGVKADRDRLSRVVDNIIQNSLKYMEKECKEIKVLLTSGSDQVQVEIHDNGIGVAEEALPFLFDTFYRTDAARSSSSGGSGLGLAIAKQMVTAHGGQIWARSEQGMGTGIYFTLKKVQ